MSECQNVEPAVISTFHTCPKCRKLVLTIDEPLVETYYVYFDSRVGRRRFDCFSQVGHLQANWGPIKGHIICVRLPLGSPTASWLKTFIPSPLAHDSSYEPGFYV